MTDASLQCFLILEIKFLALINSILFYSGSYYLGSYNGFEVKSSNFLVNLKYYTGFHFFFSAWFCCWFAFLPFFCVKLGGTFCTFNAVGLCICALLPLP